MPANETKKLTISIRGLMRSKQFLQAVCCAKDLFETKPKVFEEPSIKGMLEFEWSECLEKTKKDMKGDMWGFNDDVMVYVNDNFCGGLQKFIEFAKTEHDFEEYRPLPLYNTLLDELYSKRINNGLGHVYMDIDIGEENAGRLIIELHSDRLRNTCDNFRALCTGERGESESGHYLSYQGSIFHRLVKNGWIQGGDISLGQGDGGESIFGETFPDESFEIAHNARGIVGMANKGRHTNQSQFYITLKPTAWMDKQYVAFGKVIEGSDVLSKMEDQETFNERPKSKIRIKDSGVFEYKY